MYRINVAEYNSTEKGHVHLFSTDIESEKMAEKVFHVLWNAFRAPHYSVWAVRWDMRGTECTWEFLRAAAGEEDKLRSSTSHIERFCCP